MTKEEIILNEITTEVSVPSGVKKSEGITSELYILEHSNSTRVDPRKLAKLLAKLVKKEDLLEE